MKLKPLSGLTRPLLVLLKISLVLSLLAIPLGIYNFVEYGSLQSSIDARETVLNSDIVNGVVGLVQALVALICGVVFLRWLYRLNFNLRRLSTHVMRCTPGWVVGWFFIPLANLFKPYEAVQEMWTAAQQGQRAESPVGSWWGLWIVSSFADRAATQLAAHAKTVGEFQASAAVFVLSDLLSVALSLAALKLVRGMSAAYAQNYDEARPLSEQLEVGLTPSEDL